MGTGGHQSFRTRREDVCCFSKSLVVPKQIRTQINRKSKSDTVYAPIHMRGFKDTATSQPHCIHDREIDRKDFDEIM